MSSNIAAQYAGHERTLILAITCSLLIHGLLIAVLPNIQFDPIKTPDTLKIELVKKVEPPPTAKPEPLPEPEPVKPTTEPKPQLLPKPTPAPTAVKNEVTHSPPPPPTEVIAVAPKPEAASSPMPPAPVVAPEAPKPPVVSQADMDEARDKYRSSLWSAISKEKKYPKVAQLRGWQGEAVVELLVDSNGKLKAKKIIQSSGYDVLDKQALEMVEKAAPYPTPPEVLRGDSFTVTLSIPFTLK